MAPDEQHVVETGTACGEWQTLADVPQPRTEVTAAAVGPRIYLLGGFSPPEDQRARRAASRTVWAYDTTLDTWQIETELPHGLNHAGAVAFHGKLFVIGGFLEATSAVSDRVLIYDLRDSRWREGARMPTPRAAFAYAVADGRIHTIGGVVATKQGLDPTIHNPSSLDRSVGTHEVYDPVGDVWESLPPSPTARNHHVAGAIGKLLVVTAGRHASDLDFTTTEIWDPDLRSWKNGAALPTGRSGAAAAVADDWLYVLGGEGAGGTYDAAERYHHVDDRWEQLPPMPTARHGLGAVSIGDAVYAVAGGPQLGYSLGSANEKLVPHPCS